MRASSGLPGLFAPTWYQDRWLIDGGVVNPLPVSLCRALGADVVIAVDLSRSVTRAAMRAADGNGNAYAAAGFGRRHRGAAALVGPRRRPRRVVPQQRRSEPGLFEAMASAVNIMQERITRTRLAIDPADLVLRPDLAEFQLMDFHRAREAIDVGTRAVASAAAQLEPLKPAQLEPA